MSSSASSSYASNGSSPSTREVARFRSWKDLLLRKVKKGLQMFDVSSPKELQGYLDYVSSTQGTDHFILRKHSDTQTLSLPLFLFFDYTVACVTDR